MFVQGKQDLKKIYFTVQGINELLHYMQITLSQGFSERHEKSEASEISHAQADRFKL